MNSLNFLGARHVVSVSSGTDALRLALLAIGIGPGDEVITTPMTFIATAEAIVQTGATPSFVDIDPNTGNLSVPEIARVPGAGALHVAQRSARDTAGASLRTAGCDDRIARSRAGVRPEDRRGCMPGARRSDSYGQALCATRHDRSGGMFQFLSRQRTWAHGARAARSPPMTTSWRRRYGRCAITAGCRTTRTARMDYNARLDTIQAAVLRPKLERLEEWNLRRREIAAQYCALLERSGLQLPSEPVGAMSSYHLFVIRSPRRDVLRLALLNQKIECGIHYPVPLHLQPACRDFGYRPGDLPVSEVLADTVLSLPMHPHLTSDEVMRVANVLLEAVEGKQKLLAGVHGRAATMPLPPLA